MGQADEEEAAPTSDAQSGQEVADEESFATQTLRFAVCATGILVSLVCYGLLQERIMTVPYGSDGTASLFKFSTFLVLVNRLVAISVAATSITFSRARGHTEPLAPSCPLHKYVFVSVSNVVATTCQYEALKFVSFAFQTLMKSSKMVPVLLWGVLFHPWLSKRKSTPQDFAVAIAVCVGCSVFAMTGEVHSKISSSTTTGYGLLLMVGYMSFDGFTSTYQTTLFDSYRMTTFNQMLWVSALSVVMVTPTLFISGEIGPVTAFVSEYPAVLGDMLLLSLASTCSQLAILYMIKSFGALAYAAVATTRQMMSIVLSAVVFGSAITLGQAGGLCITFIAFYVHIYIKYLATKSKPSAPQSSPQLPGSSDEASPLLVQTLKHALK